MKPIDHNIITTIDPIFYKILISLLTSLITIILHQPITTFYSLLDARLA